MTMHILNRDGALSEADAPPPSSPPAPWRGQSTSPKPRSLIVFFALAFGISWAVWIPAALASYGLLPVQLDPILSNWLGAFGPFVAALVTTARYEGRAGLGGLFERLLIWRVGLELSFLSQQDYPAGLTFGVDTLPARKSIALRTQYWQQLDADQAAALKAVLDNPAGSQLVHRNPPRFTRDPDFAPIVQAVVRGEQTAQQALAAAEQAREQRIASSCHPPLRPPRSWWQRLFPRAPLL
jgi:hypothetical protein